MATSVSVLLPTQNDVQIGPHGSRPLNRWSLSLPNVQQQIADAWASAPPLPYGLEIDQMNDLLTKFAQNIYRQVALPMAPKLKHP